MPEYTAKYDPSAPGIGENPSKMFKQIDNYSFEEHPIDMIEIDFGKMIFTRKFYANDFTNFSLPLVVKQ